MFKGERKHVYLQCPMALFSIIILYGDEENRLLKPLLSLLVCIEFFLKCFSIPPNFLPYLALSDLFSAPSPHTFFYIILISHFRSYLYCFLSHLGSIHLIHIQICAYFHLGFLYTCIFFALMAPFFFL